MGPEGVLGTVYKVVSLELELEPRLAGFGGRLTWELQQCGITVCYHNLMGPCLEIQKLFN